MCNQSQSHNVAHSHSGRLALWPLHTAAIPKISLIIHRHNLPQGPCSQSPNCQQYDFRSPLNHRLLGPPDVIVFGSGTSAPSKTALSNNSVSKDADIPELYRIKTLPVTNRRLNLRRFFFFATFQTHGAAPVQPHTVCAGLGLRCRLGDFPG